MCDYFCQRMEKSQGDLTDILRNTTIIDPPETANFSDSFQILPEPATAFAPLHDTFGYPFANIRDQLLDELPVPSFFSSPGGLAQKMQLGEDQENIPSSCLFPKMLPISPVTSKTLPAQISTPRIQGTKRRKSQAKKVVCIPAPAAASGRPSAEAVPCDLWAWRKYGQKPIKGSPYPRGYYRCSSSKECSARKQVERSRTDPNMLVITYTSEHNHPWPTQRNALAGSTRFQPSKSNNASTSKCSDTPNQNQSAITIKKEPQEFPCSNNQVVKEETLEMEGKTLVGPQDHDFHNVFDESLSEHMMPMDSDFFTDLAELEPKGFMGDKLDEDIRDDNNPFCVFDWGGGN